MALTEEKKKVLDLIKYEPYLLGRMVGFKELTELHNEWLKMFLFGEKDQTLLAHRGSYKTTCISLFFAIHIIIKPKENILFFRKTDDDVAEVIHTTSNILSSGAFKRIVSILYDGVELILLKDTASQVHTNLCTSIKGSAQLLGLGVGTSVTGKHAEIVVTDDIVNKKDRVSAPERTRTNLLYQELQNIKNRGGRIINTGTPWHKEDTITTLMPNITKYDCYSTGLIEKEKLQELRRSMSPSLFAANYELKHIADENALFSEPQFIEDETAIYDGVAHIDAAYGGEDYTAYTVIRKLGERYIAFGKLFDKHVDDCIAEISRLHEKYRAGSIMCELNADKGYLAKELKNNGFEVKTYHEHMNKYIKISTHLRSAWDKIYWLDDTDPEYLSQILDYTENAAHDDAPDSAASLLRKLQKKGIKYNRDVSGGL